MHSQQFWAMSCLSCIPDSIALALSTGCFITQLVQLIFKCLKQHYLSRAEVTQSRCASQFQGVQDVGHRIAHDLLMQDVTQNQISKLWAWHRLENSQNTKIQTQRRN